MFRRVAGSDAQQIVERFLFFGKLPGLEMLDDLAVLHDVEAVG